MKRIKLLSTVLLLSAAALITSCQDDDNWKPTWAMPVVKEMSLMLGEFIDSTRVDDFNASIRRYWNEYVLEELDIPSGGGGQGVVDSVAFEIITKPNGDDSTSVVSYVDFTGPGGAPELNQETINKLINKGNTQEQIDAINDFLLDYWNSNPQLHTQSFSIKPLRISKIVRPKSGGTTSGDSAVNNLLDGVIHNSNDVFLTAANLVDHMSESYGDSINSKIDDILSESKMDNITDLNMRDIIKSGSQVYGLELTLDITNTLPFDVAFFANFVDDNGNTVLQIFNASMKKEESVSSRFTTKNQSELDDILNKTKQVYLSVVCSRAADQDITSAILRSLSDKGISFDMRVKLQAPMSDIMDSF